MTVQLIEVAVLGVFIYSVLAGRVLENLMHKRFGDLSVNEIVLLVLLGLVLIRVLF